MNKKDIMHVRKQFKLDHELLTIFDILNVYIMKESDEIYYYESQPFAMLDKDEQELYMGNFKKVLTGDLDQKLFELKFQHEAEDPTQHILHRGLMTEHAEDWKEQMLRIVAKMLGSTEYSQDTVITFVRGEYIKPTKGDVRYAHPFILCSINQTEQSQKTLMFDYVEKKFNCNINVDPIIRMTKPEAGFFFPTITDNSADVNHILYAVGKETDPQFIEDVLNAEMSVTAQEERGLFEEVVKEVTGDQLNTATLAQVYEQINQVIEDTEDDDIAKLDYRDVGRVLKASGLEEVTPDQVERAFHNVIHDQNYELKASNVIPKYTSKSIKINTKVAMISISPQDLKYVKQVNVNGKRCILIEVDEEAVIEGFTMSSETL